ncbi:MAG: hypothetical protein QHH07_07140 [Sedimentisphaerales bacterium]|nr:hypothetical protein [Sedimentisphaerales bacterium]
MIIPEQLIAGVMAILSLHIVGLVGTIYGLAPEVCAIRALIAAGIGYIAGRFVARCVNIILTRAMMEHMIKQRQEDGRVNKGR